MSFIWKESGFKGDVSHAIPKAGFRDCFVFLLYSGTWVTPQSRALNQQGTFSGQARGHQCNPSWSSNRAYLFRASRVWLKLPQTNKSTKLASFLKTKSQSADLLNWLCFLGMWFIHAQCREKEQHLKARFNKRWTKRCCFWLSYLLQYDMNVSRGPLWGRIWRWWFWTADRGVRTACFCQAWGSSEGFSAHWRQARRSSLVLGTYVP